ncbi:MAG: type II secretion system protein GspL [Saccharospirillum sp.]
MIPDISLYWQSPDNLVWLWRGDSETRSGDWETLVDDKQQRQPGLVNARLFLPHHWFTSLSVTVPGNARRIPDAVLRFAAEEQLAQDIESLHIVALARPEGGRVPVLVLERERLSLVQQTLAEAHIQLVQAYDAGWFQVPADDAAELVVQCDDQALLCRTGWVLHQVHPSGFGQWYDFWRSHRDTGADEHSVKVQLVSADASSQARQVRTLLEAHGDEVDWQIRPETGLVDWDKQCRQTRTKGNLMTGAFAIRKSNHHLSLWVPTAVAASLALAIWSAVTWTEAWRMERQAETTWQASEAVFREIFGPDKRIQRPLMTREVDNAIVMQRQGSDTQPASVLDALVALSDSHAEGLLLEDFRYQVSRQEMLFTLKQEPESSGDAFGRFEQTKVQLEAAGYQVEYSASAERDTARGRYRAVKRGE